MRGGLFALCLMPPLLLGWPAAVHAAAVCLFVAPLFLFHAAGGQALACMPAGAQHEPWDCSGFVVRRRWGGGALARARA